MKYRKLFILLILTCLISKIYAQEWVRTYTSTSGDGYGARWIIESYDKGYVILGEAFNYKYGLIIKTDINGNLIWKKLIGNGTYHNVPINIEHTMDSGFIVSGTISKYGSKDAFIMKLNPCFEREWCKVLHTTNQYDDYGRMVKPLPDGGFLLLSAYYEGITPGTRIHLHRFDSNGELVWQNAYAQSDSLIFGEEGFDLDIINENEYLITGDCYYPDSGQTGGRGRPFLIKADSSGSCTWETPWKIYDTYHGTSYFSAIDNKKNSYSVAWRKSATGQYPAMIITSPQGQELHYADLVDTAYFGQGQTITFMEDSNLFIALGWKDPDQTWHNGFMKADTNGIPLGFHEVIPLSNALISTAKTFDNKFITVGIHMDNSLSRWVIYAFKLNSDLEYDTLYTTPFVYDSLCPYSIPSDTTDMDCDILVLIEDKFIPLNEANLKIFPNPASEHITISFPDVTHTGQREIIIFNSLGMEVKRIRLMKGDEETRVDVSELPAGIYFVVLMDRGKRIGEGKLILVS
jgi:hypothetical protein